MPGFKQDLVEQIPHLRAFSRFLCGSPDWADDLVQETILRAWAHRGSFEPGSNLKAWLFTILRNHFYSEMRKKKRSVELQLSATPAEIGVAAAQPEKLHFKDLVREVGRLAPAQREALILVSVNGLSYEEASAVCGCAVGTVKSRVARARRELEARLGGPTARHVDGHDAALRGGGQVVAGRR